MNWPSKITQKTKYRNTEHEFELFLKQECLKFKQFIFLCLGLMDKVSWACSYSSSWLQALICTDIIQNMLVLNMALIDHYVFAIAF